MQFIKCRFREGDARLYTYQNPGEPVAVGDFVKVPDSRSDGWKRVEVAEVDVEQPTAYACKDILGKWEAADLLSDGDADLAPGAGEAA